MRRIFSIFTTGMMLLGLASETMAQNNALKNRIRKGTARETKIAGDGHFSTSNRSMPGNGIQSLWDVNISFDPTDQTGIQGWAGVVYAKGRFFCSKWNGADTLAIFDSTGTFEDILTIPGIGAVRGMTFDGTYIWAGNNTRNVQVIDPVTFTKVRQHTVPTAVGNVRWITYNPEGNAGAGSFYCGNFGTALFQVRKPAANVTNMASINNIAATVHGLTAMYGVTYEANGADSKFWAFDQGQTESAAVVVQLNANGTPTGIRRDVDLDAPAGAGGSAGGIFLADLSDFPGKTLVCMNQGGGVVGYDTKLPTFDAIFDSIGTSNGLTAWPKKWTSSSKIAGKVRSNGVGTLANFTPSVDILNAETMETIQNLQVNTVTVGGGQSQSFVTADIVPGFYETNTLYQVQGTTNYPGDETSANDTAFAFFGLTDTTMAQDYIYFDSGLSSLIGIGAASTDEKALGARFTLPAADTLTSVSYFLAAPFEGQPSSISVYGFSNGQPSATPITTTTATYTATAADEANGVAVTLKLDNPLPLPAGDFMVAVNELGDSIACLGSINFNFKPNTFFVKWNTAPSNGQWLDLLQFDAGLRRAFAIYPNFGKVSASTTTAPVCSTASVSAITFTTASVSSTVISDGGASVTERGVCWSTSPNPTIALSTKTSDGTGIGDFTSNVTGLTANTTYYIRAYATNSAGTSYGNESFFTTQSSNVLATLTTNAGAFATATSATSGGNITADGGAGITARGVCWSTTTGPTINLSTKTFDGTGTGTFTSTLTGLTPNATYYIRAYAQNSVGVAYGDEVTFTLTAPVSLATLTTTSPVALTEATATSGGNITSDGNGNITARGVCWNTSPAPTTALSTKTVDGTGTGTFTSNITGLSVGNTYFVRAYAENSAGVAYGNEVSFTVTSAGKIEFGKTKAIDFVLSPNPARVNMNILITSARTGNAAIRITDLAGKEVFTQNISLAPGKTELPVSVEALAKGAYMVEVNLGGSSVVHKFMKD
jgi:hypothetical protein